MDLFYDSGDILSYEDYAFLHSHNASYNLVLQLYLIKRTLLFFSLGWTNHLEQQLR